MKNIIHLFSILLLALNLSAQGGGALTATITNAVNDCKSGCIDLHINAGYPPYSVIWSDSLGNLLSGYRDIAGNDGLEDLCGIAPGTYTVLVFDDLCGSVTQNFQVLKDVYNYAPNITKTNPTVCSGSDGNMTVLNNLEPTKGSGEYAYKWTKDGKFYSDCPPYSLQGLSLGNYCLVATDLLYNCEFLKCDSIIANDEVMVKLDTIINQSDENVLDGAVQISVYKGIPPFTYKWTGPNGFTASSKNIAGLEKGLYTCTVTSSNGCTKVISAFVNLECKAPFVGFRIKLPCGNQSNGAIQPWSQYPCQDFKYLWSTGSTNCSVGGLSAGMYYVTVTFQDTCKNVQSFNLESQYVPSLVANVTHICGDNTLNFGKIELIGDYNYAFSWSLSGRNGKVLDPVYIAGKYCVTGIPPTPGCLIDSCFYVKKSPSMEVSVEDSYGQCDSTVPAKIIAKVTGGIKPYSYYWNNVKGDSIFLFPLSKNNTDSVSLKLIDSVGCIYTAKYKKPSPPKDNYRINSYTECSGTKGAFKLSEIKNMQPPLDITWTNNDKGYIMYGAKFNENHFATIIDARGCKIKTSPMTVFKDPFVALAFHPIIKNACYGEPNGYIYLKNEENSEKSYHWSNGNTNVKNDSLLEGKYIVIALQEPNGCAYKDSFNIINISGNFPATILGTCNGNDGAIKVDQSINKNNALSIKWKDSNSLSFNRDNLATGIYYATITYYDCTFPSEYEVKNFTDPNSTNLTVTKNCDPYSSGSILAENKYGAPPLKYTWIKDDTDTLYFNSIVNYIDNLKAGKYDLIIKDKRGCVNKTSKVILDEKLDTVFSTNKCEVKIYCNGELIKVLPNNIKGYVFAYLNDLKKIIIEASYIPGFLYTVTINKTNKITGEWNLYQTFTMNGSKEIDINNENDKFSDYEIIISDGVCKYTTILLNKCTNTDNLTICKSPSVVPCSGAGKNDGVIKLPHKFVCIDGVALSDTLVTFYWKRLSDGKKFGVDEFIISDLEPGDYELVYKRTDCISKLFTKKFTITCDCSLNVTISELNNTCPYKYNGSIKLGNVTSNHSIVWSTGQIGGSELKYLLPGEYSVNIKDESTGCKKLIRFTILQNNATPTFVKDCTWEYTCNNETYRVDFGIESETPIQGTCNNLVSCNVQHNTYTKDGGSFYGNIRVVSEVCLADKICNNGFVIQNDISAPVMSFVDKQQCLKYNKCTFENQVYIIPNSTTSGKLVFVDQLDTCKSIEYCRFLDGTEYETGNVKKGVASWVNNDDFTNCEYIEECKIGTKKYFTDNFISTPRDTCFYYQYYFGDYNCNILTYCKKDPGNYSYKVFLTVITDTSDCIAKFNKYTKCDPNNLPFLHAEERNTIKNVNYLDIIKKIYPNPFADKISIDINTPKMLDFKMYIYDMYGNLVLDKIFTVYPNIETVEIMIPNLPSGVYNFVIKNKEFNISKNTKLIHIEN